MELILVYTGKGKGKTSACVGQAARALGNGLSVAFAQFMKRDGRAGEQKILAQLLGEKFRPCGLGFLRNESEKAAHRRKAKELLEWAAAQEARMLIMDEAIYALHYDLITQAELCPFLENARGENAHLALSGRYAPDWLLDQADMVTDMREMKHQLARGCVAMPGIEY